MKCLSAVYNESILMVQCCHLVTVQRCLPSNKRMCCNYTPFTLTAQTHDAVKEQVASSTGGILDKAKDVVNNTTSSVFGTIGGVGKYISMADSKLKPETTELRATVSMYMPDTLALNYNIEYNEISLSDATNGWNRLFFYTIGQYTKH